MANFQFDPDSFIQRCWLLLVSPEKEWIVIREEEKKPLTIYLSFALPLIVMGSFTLWAGHFFAWNGLSEGIIRILTQSLFLWAYALGVYLIMPLFGAQKNFTPAFKIAVYSLSVIWIVDIPGNLSVFFAWVKIFSLYAVYVLWAGIHPLFKIPGKNRPPAFIVLLFFVLIVYFVFGLIEEQTGIVMPVR